MYKVPDSRSGTYRCSVVNNSTRMNEEIRTRKIDLGINWVKSDSGATYLCPTGRDFSGASDEELRAHCLDESSNPQND